MARSLGVHRGGLSTPGKTALPGPSQVRFPGCWRALCSLVFNDLSQFEPSRRGASLRRTLEVISLGLFLVGLELATGTPSLTVVRLREALAHPLGSDAAEGVAWRSLAGIGLVAGAIILAWPDGRRSLPPEGDTGSRRLPDVWGSNQESAAQPEATHPRTGARQGRLREALRRLWLDRPQLFALTT